MSEQKIIAVRPDDYEKFKQIAFLRKKKLISLFHEWVEREMTNEVV
jgi:hypothetical protein